MKALVPFSLLEMMKPYKVVAQKMVDGKGLVELDLRATSPEDARREGEKLLKDGWHYVEISRLVLTTGEGP